MPTQTSKNITMDDLLAHAGGKIHGVQKGHKIAATFIDADRGQARFNIGGKTEAIVGGSYFTEAKDFIKTLKVGQKVTAIVMDPEDREGHTLLSLKHAAADLFWKELASSFNNGETVNVLVKGITDRGITVELSGNAAFIPFSQLKPETVDRAEELLGTRLKVQVLEVDQQRARIVLSERAIADAENVKKLKELLSNIKEGSIFAGIVTTITSFGAFVEIDLNGTPVEGLVHVSELSWGSKVTHPSEVLNEGDSVEVAILGTSNGKLSLSIKRAQADPWETVSEKFKVDDRLTGTVTRMSDFGAFVNLADGIEGLIHITKIPPTVKLSVGDTVNVYIEEIHKGEHRISLGIILTASKPIGYK